MIWVLLKCLTLIKYFHFRSRLSREKEESWWKIPDLVQWNTVNMSRVEGWRWKIERIKLPRLQIHFHVKLTCRVAKLILLLGIRFSLLLGAFHVTSAGTVNLHQSLSRRDGESAKREREKGSKKRMERKFNLKILKEIDFLSLFSSFYRKREVLRENKREERGKQQQAEWNQQDELWPGSEQNFTSMPPFV